jgi:hypothetical protein
VFAGLLNQARERNCSIWASLGCSGIGKEDHTIKRWRPAVFEGKLWVTKETGMANDVRHAAWQTERRFAVRLLPEDGPSADLASGLTEFLDAFDFASEWVSREDPARDGTTSLAIVETQDGVAEEVWTYTPGQPAPDFSPLNWAAVPAFPNRERRSRLSQRVSAAAGNRAASAAPPSPAWPPAVVAPAPDPVVDWAEQPVPSETPLRKEPAPRAAPRKWLRARVRAAWGDRVSRGCLIGFGASLWFSVGLADPQFLLPLLALSPALWWRERNRDMSPPEAEPEDWV